VNPSATPKSRVFVLQGLLLPGQELTLVRSYRVLAAEDRILLTVTPMKEEDLVGEVYLPAKGGEHALATKESLAAFGKESFPVLDAEDPGFTRAVLRDRVARLPEPVLAYDTARLPAPVAPFDPKWSRRRGDRPEAWAYSPSLGGYILRVRAGSYSFQTEEIVRPLPPVPFRLFEEIDGEEGETKLLRTSGDVTVLTKANVLDVLEEVLRARRQVTFSDAPDRAPFEEKEM
jgi:hypothetical protein